MHVCLVPWDELDEVSDSFNELVRCAGDAKKYNFKAYDYDIIQNVPLFLRTKEHLIPDRNHHRLLD